MDQVWAKIREDCSKRRRQTRVPPRLLETPAIPVLDDFIARNVLPRALVVLAAAAIRIDSRDDEPRIVQTLLARQESARVDFDACYLLRERVVGEV
jgi:hypothetical protein